MLSTENKLKFLVLFGILAAIAVIWISKDSSNNKNKSADEGEDTFAAYSTNMSTTQPPLVTLDLLVSKVQCQNDSDFTSNWPEVHEKVKTFLEDKAISERTIDCDSYFSIVSTHAFEEVTREEDEFPIAFSHTGKLFQHQE